MAEDRTQAWSRHWATGATHSCAGSFDLEGAGDVAAFWRAVFDPPQADACLLDLGTGNGGLLQLALKHEAHRAGEAALIGIDLAQPAPRWLTPELATRVQLRGHTPMEATGLADASVDLLVSQFGIEYATRGRVQTESLRVLRPRSRIAFVIHHADSVITRVARDECAAQQFLAGEDGLLAAAAALLPHMADARAGHAPGAEAHAARDHFNQQMARGQALAATLAAPDLLVQAAAGLQHFLAAVTPENLANLQHRLSAYGEEVSLAGLRSAEQIDCAMTEAALLDFLTPFREAGFQLHTRTLHEAGHRVAWAVEGARGAWDQSSPSSVASP